MARRAEPPDGGWGWMVVLSAFFQSALVFGVLRSFGVFFVEFVAAFEEQAARVSWIASIGIAVQQFGSYLRDVTGNYTASFVVAGAFLLTGSGVLTTLPHFFSCFSASTSRPQDLVIEALDTKVPLPREEGLGEDRTLLRK